MEKSWSPRYYIIYICLFILQVNFHERLEEMTWNRNSFKREKDEKIGYDNWRKLFLPDFFKKKINNVKVETSKDWKEWRKIAVQDRIKKLKNSYWISISRRNYSNFNIQREKSYRIIYDDLNWNRCFEATVWVVECQIPSTKCYRGDVITKGNLLERLYPPWLKFHRSASFLKLSKTEREEARRNKI